MTTIKGTLNVVEPVTLDSTLQIGSGLKGGQIYSTSTDHEVVIDPFALDTNSDSLQDASGYVTILGDLIVKGNTTTFHSVNVDISDHLLKIASGSTSAGQTNGAGIEVGDGYATFTYNSAGSGSWTSNVGLNVIGNTSVTTFDCTGATSLATNGGSVNIASLGASTTIKGTLNVDEAVTISGNFNVGTVNFAHVPSGVIVMWSGESTNIPNGWVLCDGNNNTPNLSGRFIVGYSASDSDYNNINNNGGNKNFTITENNLPLHSHSCTVSQEGSHTHSGSTNNDGSHDHLAYSGQAGAHTHTITELKFKGSSSEGGDGFAGVLFDDQDGQTGTGNSSSWLQSSTLTQEPQHNHSITVQTNNSSHKHNFTTQAGSQHNHNVVIEQDGGITSPNSIDNRPPYWVLCYIMKT